MTKKKTKTDTKKKTQTKTNTLKKDEGKVQKRPYMCHIFEKHMAQGYQL